MRLKFLLQPLLLFILICVSIYLNIDKFSFAKDNSHPKLYLDKSKVAFLQSKLDIAPYSAFWKAIKKSADTTSRMEPPESTKGYEDDSIRQLARPLPNLAIAYLLTNDDVYLQASKKWLNALSSYPDWADNKNLGAAELLFAMGISYDWLYNYLTEEERYLYEKKIVTHADILYSVLINKEKMWTKDLLQNHNYTNVMAITVAGLALSQNEPKSKEWLKATRKNFRQVLKVLSPDGASHEGVGYWSGGMDSLLRNFMAESSFGDDNSIKINPYFQNAAKFRLHAALPDYKEVVDYADSPRFDYKGPSHILRLMASSFEDGTAQWLADKIDQVRGDEAEYSWQDLLWFDEKVLAIEPFNLARSAYFDNLGIFMGRSDWGEKAFWYFFKAGPPQGKLAEDKKRYTGSHIHPDEGQLLLWKEKWLVIDDGYVFKKRTDNHNVLTFNNVGQLGDGKKWFNKKDLKKYAKKSDDQTVSIIRQNLQTDYQYLTADLTNIYHKQADLKKWQRTFIAVQGKYILIKDEVMLNKPGDIKGYIHLAGIPQAINENTICLDEKAMMVGLFPKGSYFQLSKYTIPKKEQKKYGNYEGTVALISSINQDSYKQFVFFSTDDNACKKEYTLEPATDDILIIKSGNQELFRIDFQNTSISF